MRPRGNPRAPSFPAADGFCRRRQSVRQGGIVLIFAAAVQPDGDGGDQHQLLRRDPAQVFPRGAHHGKVCLRVSVGQKHGGGHPGVDTKLRPGAVLRGNIAAVAGRGKCMLCRQIAPHEPVEPTSRSTDMVHSPLHIYTKYIIAYRRGKSNALRRIAQGVADDCSVGPDMSGPPRYGKRLLRESRGPGMPGPYRSADFKNSSIILSPTAPDFSGWNWQPRTLPWVAAAQICRPP